MKGGLLKKLKLISTIRRGLSFHQNCQTPPLSDKEDLISVDDGDDFSSCSLESSMLDDDDFEDAKLSASDESTVFPLSEDSSTSTGSEPDMFPAASEEVDDNRQLPDIRTGPVVLYSTSLTGIRKTFEDCRAVRFLLKSFRVRFEERDVSMHREYRDELWDAIGGKEEGIPPKLFIGGRCIGGAEEVVGLHERGELRKLLEGMPLETSSSPCRGCGNLKFVICSSCSGSRRRVVVDDHSSVCEKWSSCGQCNENGLVKCPICNISRCSDGMAPSR